MMREQYDKKAQTTTFEDHRQPTLVYATFKPLEKEGGIVVIYAGRSLRLPSQLV